MLEKKPSVHLQHRSFDPLHSFYKSIHTKPNKIPNQIFQNKHCTSRESQFSTRRIRQSEMRKAGTYFSNCSLFQAKRARLKHSYQRNHSSGWLEKILTKKSSTEKQQFQKSNTQKITKLITYENELRKKLKNQLDKESAENRTGCWVNNLRSEIGEVIILKKIHSKGNNAKLRLTQPAQSDRKGKKSIMKEFGNKIDINIRPWTHQYCQ